MYLKKGNWKLQDITATEGLKGIHKWHMRVTMVDTNGDGWLDIYLYNSGDINGDVRANELYIIQKNETFKETISDAMGHISQTFIGSDIAS